MDAADLSFPRTQADPPGHGRRRAGRRWRADLGAVDDDHQDRRRRRHARSRSTRSPPPGADIVRCTCNDTEAAEGLAQIVPRSPVPIVADIHHQYKMALAALEAGVHCLRLNPGNIRKPEHIKAGRQRGQGPRRADPHRRQRRLARPDAATRSTAAVTPEAMVESALQEIGLLRRGRLRPHQDLGQGVERAADDRGLPAAVRGDRPSAAPRRHRGRSTAGGPDQGHGRHRHAAGRGHRRHDPLLAHGRPGRGSPRRSPAARGARVCASARTST